MAGWISSKLKVAETFLQQIDQQAAESLGKNERPGSPSHGSPSGDSAPRNRPDSTPPLKLQLPRKSRPPSPDTGTESPSRGKPPDIGRPDPAPAATAAADGDWTELLSSPAPAARPNAAAKKPSTPAPPLAKGIRKGFASRAKPARKLDAPPEGEIVKNSPQDGESPSYSAPSDLKQVHEIQEGGDSTKYQQDIHQDVDSHKMSSLALEEDRRILADRQRVDGTGGSGGEHRSAGESEHPSLACESSRSKDKERSSSGSEESDSGRDSESTSDSEEEREREEMRRRRAQKMAERMEKKAAEAIKDREDYVARLEGEKESLEKILREREMKQAQEASELQISMIETMEAVDIEKQKHNSTRMEALARLAALETTNAELAKSLVTTQWNLEVEVNRVAELRQQVELKEVAQEEYKRKISKICHSVPSLDETEYLKRFQLEEEILDAEYSFICDKLVKLKDKAKKLEESIEVTKREMVHPTEVEIELKKRLDQLTDRLIQKQTQVEALSSEKATLTLRMETVSRMLDESGLSLQASGFADISGIGLGASSSRIDIEAGAWQPSGPARGSALHDRIRTGKRKLGSVLWQLDAIFSAGVVYLKRNPKAQVWSFLYLLCLHLWVMYILSSHSQVWDSGRSGAVYSLEAINKTSGS